MPPPPPPNLDPPGRAACHQPASADAAPWFDPKIRAAVELGHDIQDLANALVDAKRRKDDLSSELTAATERLASEARRPVADERATRGKSRPDRHR